MIITLLSRDLGSADIILIRGYTSIHAFSLHISLSSFGQSLSCLSIQSLHGNPWDSSCSQMAESLFFACLSHTLSIWSSCRTSRHHVHAGLSACLAPHCVLKRCFAMSASCALLPAALANWNVYLFKSGPSAFDYSPKPAGRALAKFL